MIAVLIPVLGRPHRVEPIVESLAACSKVIPCRPVFLVSPDDNAEIKAIGKVLRKREHEIGYYVTDWPGGSPGDYARKMNLGFAMTDEPFVFFGADDLVFHRGWAERAVAKWYETDLCVIGTNDLGNSRVTSGRHSTHTLVDRDYLRCGGGTADEQGKLLHEGYFHNFVDDEFIQTAMWRGTYAHAGDSIVEHLHPNWGKGHEDATYRIGMARFTDDRALFGRRAPLWSSR